MYVDYTNDAIKFRIGDFLLFFPTNVKFETFNYPQDYYGIIFAHNGKKFQVIECKLGTRLLINGKEGESKDLPFNNGTWGFLPDFIKISVLQK